MQLVQTLGYSAFVLASLVLAARLMLLWRRTGETPELILSVSFLTGGALGYAAWFASAVQRLEGWTREEVHGTVVLALVLTCIGAWTIGLGALLIFHRGERRFQLFVGLQGLVMAAGTAMYAVLPQGTRDPVFWVPMLTAGTSYVWTAWECRRLYELLKRRARIGLASAILVRRARLWAVAYGAVAMMIVLAYVEYLALGAENVGDPYFATVRSLFGLVCASCIWFGFFPPAFYRRRFSATPDGMALG